MKKIIAIILSLVMIFSLTACGKKNDSKKDPVEEPTAQVTDQIVDDQGDQPSSDGSEDVLDDSSANKQGMWESIFKAGAFSVLSNSFEMNMNDIMNIKVLTDDEGKSLISVSGEVDGVDVGATLYQKDSENIYFHQVSNTEDGVIDEWYMCEISDENDNETIESTMSENEFFGDVKESLKMIEKIEYKDTIDGIDLVDIFCKQESEQVSSDWTTNYDASIEVEYNGQSGQFRYTEMTPTEGNGISSSIGWEIEIEGVDIYDCTFDKDAMTLTLNDQTLNCTLVEDHLNSPSEDNLIVMHAEIYSESNAIKRITTNDGGITTSIEFIDCADVAEFVTIPDNIEKTMPAEEAAMNLAMAMFTLAFANAETIE